MVEKLWIFSAKRKTQKPMTPTPPPLKITNGREAIATIIGDIVTFSISMISSALQLKFVCVTSFVLLLGQMRYLLKKITSEHLI